MTEEYDWAACQYSPDGKVFQVDYAQKVVNESANIIAVAWDKGVVLAADRELTSKLCIEDSQKRIDNITSGIGFAGPGLYADCLATLLYARKRAMKHLKNYRIPTVTERLADEVAARVHKFTSGVSRPFGSEVLIASWSPQEGGALYVVDTTGYKTRYKGYATGRDRQIAKAEMARIVRDAPGLSADEVKEKVVALIRQLQPKRDNRRIDIGWSGEENNGEFTVTSIDG